MLYRRNDRSAFKKNNVKIFLFFLLFTSFLWLLLQFSKNYTKEVEVSISYTNLPKDRILNDESDQTIKMVLNGNGFRLISQYWSTSKLYFDLNDAVSKNNNEYHFYLDKETIFIKNKLDFKGKVLRIQKDTLVLKLDVNLEKKIPVKINKNIQFTNGYGSNIGLVAFPDSVTISGPSKIVDTIQFIESNELKLEGLNSNYKTELGLNIDRLPTKVSITPNKIETSIEVSKFTEGSQKVPITLKNVPEGVKINIFPKEVTVVYRVGLDKYNEIYAIDFKIEADYNKVSNDSSFLILELITIPKSIHDVRLQDKQVQYVILKQEIN